MLKVGQFLGDRYEIIAQIGIGGMAEVYRAKCHKLNRMVAIKVLKDEFNDKNFVTKFKAEAQAAAGLSHPNIVSIYDVGDEEDIHYIVMELVEGITLKQYIAKKKKLEIKEAIGITIQIAQGIGAAHEQHIIHRDIKPQNVIISRDGKVKVTDFGIAKVASSNTIDSKAVGSVYYFSPEQARGGYCDERSDIYSLGITLYEMLTGQVPFVGESTVAIALAHLQMDMTPPREIDPLIPVSLEKIIQKATQKKPERRYATASELISDLRKALLMPDEDFVKMMPTETTSPTLLIGEEEITAIKQNKTVTIIDDDGEVSASENKNNVSTEAKKHKAIEEDDPEDDSDEDENTKSNTVLDKIILVFAIIICFLIVIIAGIVLTKTLQNARSQDETTTIATTEAETTISNKSVVMPKVVGMSFEEAAKLLKSDYSLGVTRVEQASEDIAEGVVIAQEYAEGVVVDKNISVTLTVSSGSAMITLPPKNKIVGVAVKTVRRDLKALGLVVKEETEYSKDVEADAVIKIDPEPGEKVEAGSEVTIYISLGEEIQYVFVPELKGYTIEEAEDILDTDLIIDEVEEAFSDGTSYTKGQIMTQSLDVNTKVEKGTKINLTISKGNEFGSVPKVEEYTESEVKELMEKAGFVYSDTEEEFDEEIEEDKVISVKFAETDMKGESARLGAKYTIIVSKGMENVKVPDIVGKKEADAKKELTDADLEVGEITYEPSDTVAEGEVISQSVDADTEVKTGEKIDFVVSSGVKVVEIPKYKVFNNTYEDAKKALEDLGFIVDEPVYELSSSVSAGFVIKCNFSEGQKVPYGSKIVLTVAKAPEHVHEFSVATCTTPGKCSCGEIGTAALGHDFGDNNKTCSRCGIDNPDYVEPTTESQTAEEEVVE